MTNSTSASPSVLDWLAANLHGLAIGVAVAIGIVGVMLVLRMIGRRIHEADPMCHSWRGVIGNVLSKTSVLFMVVAAADIVASYTDMPARLAHGFDVAFIIVAAIQTAVWARELIVGIIRSRVGEDPGATTLGNAMGIIRVLVSVAAFAIAFIVILDNLGVNVTALIAGLGIGGIAIGLAAQGIFSDLFAALSIVFDRPFRRGDTIRFGGTVGTVERIGLKTTRIRAIGGEQVIMANNKLLEQELSNLADASSRRVTIPFSLVYQTSPDTIEGLPALLEPLITPLDGCRFVRALALAFAPSSIDCELVYDQRTNDPDMIARTRSVVLIAVARLFEREKIAFAYPTQTTFTSAPDGTLVMPWAPPPSRD
jgi:small-conductance mechanosensitive channel